MRDISKPFRIAVATALQGNVGANVYDEKKWVGATDTTFVILSTQQQTPSDDNDSTWISKCSIDIEIYDKTYSEVTKSTMDEVANNILAILIPTPFNTSLVSSNLQFQLAYCESIISRNLSLSETESVMLKVLRFVVTITQQL